MASENRPTRAADWALPKAEAASEGRSRQGCVGDAFAGGDDDDGRLDRGAPFDERAGICEPPALSAAKDGPVVTILKN